MFLNQKIIPGQTKKDGIPICKILDVSIAAVDMEWALAYIEKNIKNLKGQYICVSNVHTTVMSYDNENYRKIQNEGAMALPDGSPLSVIMKKRGYVNASRVTGPDLMEEIFKRSVLHGYRHFFYGSTKETLLQLQYNLNNQYPGIQIAGMISPPFNGIDSMFDKEAIEEMNASNPDFIWVGLGAPKQEVWMAEHKYKVNGLMIGVGAGFDYHAGKLKRAPKWMQKNSLEWLYRLWQEPKRLFTRYLTTNAKFIFLLAKEKFNRLA